METETEFTTIQEVLDGAYEKFGGWSMSANEVINWIATELEALGRRTNDYNLRAQGLGDYRVHL